MILNTVISDSLMNALGWTLLHSVWQVGVVGLITALLLKSFQHKTAQLRYGIATTALFTLFAWTTYSFIVQYQHHKNQTAIQNSMEFNPTIDSPTALPSIATPIPQNEVLDLFVAQKSNLELLQNNWQSFLLNSTWTQQVEQYLPYLVYLWLLGFVICFARFAGNLGVVYYLKNHGLQAVQPYWTERINRLQQQMAIRKTVTLAHSALVQVPMVLGYFKPVVLLPISAFSGLSNDQIEGILAHELAHIKRNDFLVNILQSMVETVLFFHPVTWWLSNKIREERENCCDDIAVAQSGDCLNYAKALTTLATLQLNPSTPVLATAFTGQNKHLLNRIQRLFGNKQARGDRKSGSLLFVLLLTIGVLVGSWHTEAKQQLVVFQQQTLDFLQENTAEVTAFFEPIEELRLAWTASQSQEKEVLAKEETEVQTENSLLANTSFQWLSPRMNRPNLVQPIIGLATDSLPTNRPQTAPSLPPLPPEMPLFPEPNGVEGLFSEDNPFVVPEVGNLFAPDVVEPVFPAYPVTPNIEPPFAPVAPLFPVVPSEPVLPYYLNDSAGVTRWVKIDSSKAEQLSWEEVWKLDDSKQWKKEYKLKNKQKHKIKKDLFDSYSWSNYDNFEAYTGANFWNGNDSISNKHKLKMDSLNEEARKSYEKARAAWQEDAEMISEKYRKAQELYREAQEEMRSKHLEQTEKYREEWQEQREKIRAEQEEIREKMRETHEATREKMLIERERINEEQERVWEEHSKQNEASEGKFSQLVQDIESALVEDGLIKDSKRYDVKITPSMMKVNREKMTSKVHQRYIAIIKASGIKLNGSFVNNVNRSKLEIQWKN